MTTEVPLVEDEADDVTLAHRLQTLQSNYDELASTVRELYATQQHLQDRISDLDQQLSFYSSFDTLLYEGFETQIAEAMETARAIHERARAEADRIVQEAEEERERILSEARQQTSGHSHNGDRMRETSAHSTSADKTLEHITEDASTEIIVAGFDNFSQVVAFQNVLEAIPQINRVTVRHVHRGTLSLAVEAPAHCELPAEIQALPGFDVTLEVDRANLLRFAVQQTHESRDGNADVHEQT